MHTCTVLFSEKHWPFTFGSNNIIRIQWTSSIPEIHLNLSAELWISAP